MSSKMVVSKLDQTTLGKKERGRWASCPLYSKQFRTIGSIQSLLKKKKKQNKQKTPHPLSVFWQKNTKFHISAYGIKLSSEKKIMPDTPLLSWKLSSEIPPPLLVEICSHRKSSLENLSRGKHPNVEFFPWKIPLHLGEDPLETSSSVEISPGLFPLIYPHVRLIRQRESKTNKKNFV